MANHKQTTRVAADIPRSEPIRTTVFRIVPHMKDGKPVPERWDMEELVVSGVVESRKVHESGQVLPVVRERHTLLTARYTERDAPETWELVSTKVRE